MTHGQEESGQSTYRLLECFRHPGGTGRVGFQLGTGQDQTAKGFSAQVDTVPFDCQPLTRQLAGDGPGLGGFQADRQ